MNFLAHFALSGSNPELILGNFLGDFLHAGEENHWPKDVQRGIFYHRRIDCFTDTHDTIRNLRRMFPPPHRRFSGIILDVAFDHYLLQHWNTIYPDLDQQKFIRQCYDWLLNSRARFPSRAQYFLDFMVSTDLLNRYARIDEGVRSLDQLSYRIKQPNGLYGAYNILTQLDEELEQGFRRFYTEIMQFSKKWLHHNSKKKTCTFTE